MAAWPGRRPARRESDGVAKQPTDRVRVRGEAGLGGQREAVRRLALAPEDGIERLVADYDAAMEIALTGVERAFVEAEGDWADRMTAAIAQLLELAAANPERTRLCTIAIFDAGEAGRERRDRWMLRFMRLCEAGFAQAGGGAPTRLMPQVAAGAIFELIRTHAADDRISELPDALPTATLVALAPILGRDAALQAGTPTPTRE